jgi:hypothetical protein
LPRQKQALESLGADILPGLTSAILDRVLHPAEMVIIEGKSFRLKDKIEQ